MTPPPLQISGNPVIAPFLNKMFGIRNGIDQVRAAQQAGRLGLGWDAAAAAAVSRNR